MEAVDPVALARRVLVWEVRHAVRAPSPADVLHVDEGARRAGIRVHVPEGLTTGPFFTPAEAERTPSSARSGAAICPLPWGNDATHPPRRSGDLCRASGHLRLG